MRTVDAHLLGDKIDDAVTHYINTHQPGEHVHIDTDGMPMSVQDDGSRITIMHQHTYSSHLCRQVTEQVGDGPWGEELLDPEGRIAAIVAQLASSRTSQPHPHHKVSARSEVDTSVILDSSIRFNGQNLNQQSVSLAGLPPMQTLPPLQEMKRCETDWFSDKNKKRESQIGQLTDSDGPVLDLPSGSPAQNRQQNRKSLPHKKRISRKLKRNNGGSTPQQDLVVINSIEPVVAPAVEEEQILPDSYVTVPQHSHHMPHGVRANFICQICGMFYGEEQLKFFQHLKQHYEPHHIIIDSPVAELVMDKMTNTCIVDNVAQLPDSIVELSLENTVPKTMYQPIDKHTHGNIVPLNYNNMKVQYSMASVDKETPVEAEKADLYETLDKLEFYNCGKCTKTFRKQKQCEAHMRDAHTTNTKLEDMGEFSEPEDLMANIHVCVGEYEPPLLPQLTVDNGHVTQDHTRHWYSRSGAQLDNCDSCNECTNDGYCAGCDRDTQQHTQTHNTQPHHTQPHHTQPHHTQHHHTQSIHVSGHHMESHQNHDSHSQQDSHSHVPQPLKILKEEVLQRIFESEVPTSIAYSNIIHDQQNDHEDDHEPSPEHVSEHINGHSNDHASHNEHSNEHANSNDVNESNDYERKHNLGVVEKEKKWITVTVEGPAQPLEPKGNGKRKRLECSECGRVFSHRNSLMYHMLSHAARQHACPHCDKTFFFNRALPSYRSQRKRLECSECGRVFSHRNSLMYHMLSHAARQHACPHCDKTFFFNRALPSYRSQRKRLECSECGRVFSHRNSLMYHMLSHAARQHACPHCDKTFFFNRALPSYRSQRKRLECSECGRVFSHRNSLMYHMLSHAARQHACPHCDKTFFFNRALPSYRSQRKRLECSECGRVFSHRNSLMYHMLSHAARQHACPHCDKTFFTAGALKIHKRVHNGDKPYKCDLCERRFRQWSDLKYHTISLHSNQKHFKCEFCGKEFARKYSLNLHRRIHTGERNYKCEYCSKTFSASSYRLTHMRTHTGDRPFKCDQCEKSFRSGFDLRRHCQVHEKIRNRFEENKPKPKDKKIKIDKDEKPALPKERKIKAESPEPPRKSPKKKSAIKKGAPNVTVQNRDGQFKLDYPNLNTNTEFEHSKNLHYTKFKVIYEDEDFKDPIPYKSQPYRDSDRDVAVLRPIRDDRHYRENTDGKLQIFTHIEKGKEYSGSIVSNSQALSDIRHLEREVAREARGDSCMNGEADKGFIERFAALYNLPA